MEEKKEIITAKSGKNDREHARKMAERRLRLHRIRILSSVIGVILLLAAIFLVFVAHYDFGKKAWIVKWDPIHGYAYTMYSKQEYSHARIVITASSKKSEDLTIPDTIWGVRVEELADNSISDSVKNIKLGKYVYLVGEGFSDRTLSASDGYSDTSTYLAIKDKDASGFYYKLQKDQTLVAYAYFGTQEAYVAPSTAFGFKVSRCTQYYVNDDYLVLLAETFATHESTVPFNMVKVKQIQQNGINPYMRYLTSKDSKDKTRKRIYALPENFNFLPDGSPADGETAIKMAFLHNGDGKGNNTALVMAKYSPLDFIAAVEYITKYTDDCHEPDELNFGDWTRDGMDVIN